MYYVLQAIRLEGRAHQRSLVHPSQAQYSGANPLNDPQRSKPSRASYTLPSPQRSGAQPLYGPQRSKTTGTPSLYDPLEPKREGQGSGRRSRRSRIEVARCIDLLGLTFTNLTLCWITILPSRDNDC